MQELTLLGCVSQILNRLRRRMRTGVYSRRPLEILRLEVALASRHVCCDWFIRPADEWDQCLSASARVKLQSQQVLQDALLMRALIFQHFPEIRTTDLCAFRQAEGGTRELILTGAMQRDDEMPSSVRSLAMRAHLFGFQFMQNDGVLCALPFDGVRSKPRR